MSNITIKKRTSNHATVAAVGFSCLKYYKQLQAFILHPALYISLVFWLRPRVNVCFRLALQYFGSPNLSEVHFFELHTTANRHLLEQHQFPGNLLQYASEISPETSLQYSPRIGRFGVRNTPPRLEARFSAPVQNGPETLPSLLYSG